MNPRLPRRPVQWSSIRELTLGDVVDRTRRQAGYAGIVAAVVVVAVFFPGKLPLSRQLLPSGGAAGGGATSEVAGETAERFPAGSDGDGALPHGRSSAGPLFGPGAFGADYGQTGGAGDTGGGRPAPDGGCTADAGSPEPVAGPTIEQAETAQTALEAGVGQPFPVDLVGTLNESVCGGAGASSADLLLLGRFVPRDNTALLVPLAPVIAPACAHARDLAVLEAMVTGAVSPALRDALTLCGAADAARLEPAITGAAPATTVPAPGLPATPAGTGDVDVDGDVTPPAAPAGASFDWGSPRVF